MEQLILSTDSQLYYVPPSGYLPEWSSSASATLFTDGHVLSSTGNDDINLVIGKREGD